MREYAVDISFPQNRASLSSRQEFYGQLAIREKKAPGWGQVLGFYGAGRETRTLKVLPPADFESAAFTNSTIPAWRYLYIFRFTRSTVLFR